MRNKDITALILSLKQDKEPFMVCIDGPDFPGKTEFIGRLSLPSDEYQVVNFKDFFTTELFSRRTDIKQIGASFNWTRLRDEILIPLKNSETATYNKVNSKTKKIHTTHKIHPKGLIFIEGTYTNRIELRSYYDFKIFISADTETRLGRRFKTGFKRINNCRLSDENLIEDKYFISEHKPLENSDIVINASSDDFNENTMPVYFSNKYKIQ
ncbi:MAG: hypothetical protein JW982_07210 [Spirochaetes bacterium]|nr:hypothetical protein [Spirochaetota bacterium]